jgi:hypothetical protein
MSAATYCPEDNKLRLYVGRVPRDEYETLRAEGWTSTPKQSCDFVAHWTPERVARALSYADLIEDEDAGPAERAADRAERFAEYRDKRTDEATGHADRYDAGPAAHGYQSQARADRSAARHDRIAGRAGDAWSKAEYWQRRTGGVISHALHVCTPSVRMGRIKIIETELRGLLARWENTSEPMTERAQAWKTHYELRLAYENQMIDAQGGRAGVVEMEAGGTWLGGTIAKVNKSSTTGRVVSVGVIVPRVTEWHYRVTNVPGTPFALCQFETERAKPESYKEPTAESFAKLAEFEAAKQAAAAVRKATVPACPLVNPTDEDAERLQALWNAQIVAKGERSRTASKYNYCPELEGEQSKVLRTTQANYSAVSGGTYSHAATTEIETGGQARTGYRGQYKGKVCCKLRTTSGEQYKAPRVIVLTDKPQKPFPAALWIAEAPAAPAFALEMSDASQP